MRKSHPVSVSFILLISLFLSSVKSLHAQGDRLLDAKEVMNRAFYDHTPDRLSKAMDAFQPLTSSGDPEVKKLAYYYMGYAAYRLSSAFSGLDEKETGRYLDEAVRNLEKATELDYNFSEAVALLGNCYGMKATSFFSALKFGPRSDRTLQKAVSMAPENPRIRLMYGISFIFKPAMFGGSLEKAIEELKRSADLFTGWEAESELYPEWGNEEVYAWLGKAFERAGRYERSEQSYKRALEINPDYYWVKEILLPELREKL